MLETIDIEPRGQHRASVIWLHGLGANGNDFVPIVPELRLPDALGVRFVFPHAPMRPVTLNNGMEMRAWYDILGLGGNAPQDQDGIEASRTELEALIGAENQRGIPASRIVVAGFSQGGAIALHTGLRYPDALAGIMGLSTYLPLADTLAGQLSRANTRTAVFMAHGKLDPVLPHALGEASRDALVQLGYTVDWHSFQMQHQVCLEEIRMIGSWLETVLG